MTAKNHDRRKIFKMPSVQNIISRKSSITNAFVNSVIPTIDPSAEDIKKAFAILRMDLSDMRCAYCGDKSSGWDHLRPVVLNHRPTGYISEIGNLVPACSKCNSSKGNSSWREWMLGSAEHSPTGRGVVDVAERVARIEKYERWRSPIKVDFESILGLDDWARYWLLWENMIAEMQKCQKVADTIRTRIIDKLGGK
jgi:hypothetical protein